MARCSREEQGALRVAIVHVIFNVLGVALWFAFIPSLADLVREISPVEDGLEGAARLAAEVPRQVANAHAVFNIANTIVMLPFAGILAALVTKMVPDRPEEPLIRPEFLDRDAMAVPSLGFTRSRTTGSKCSGWRCDSSKRCAGSTPSRNASREHCRRKKLIWFHRPCFDDAVPLEKETTHRFDHEPFLVPPGKRISLSDYDSRCKAGLEGKEEAGEALKEDIARLAAAQALLWAKAEHSVLIILQAMDAAGKDGAIKHVMSGVNPQGVDVTSFKAPNEEERLHHFLWRPMRKLPARGRIAIFNRSYYEEVLVVRVHPEFLEKQYIPSRLREKSHTKLWKARYEAINEFERIVISADTTVIKFFLNVSKAEQKKRFLERLDNPEKHWKFSAADLRERAHWGEYEEAFEDMLNATSTDEAPWYVIPADRKWFARAAIADIIASRIEDLKLEPPKLSEAQLADLAEARKQLEHEG